MRHMSHAFLTGHSHSLKIEDKTQATICCLRCGAELHQYSLAHSGCELDEPGVRSSYAVLECAACGHVEFLSKRSPIIENLPLIMDYSGDGD